MNEMQVAEDFRMVGFGLVDYVDILPSREMTRIDMERIEAFHRDMARAVGIPPEYMTPAQEITVPDDEEI